MGLHFDGTNRFYPTQGVIFDKAKNYQYSLSGGCSANDISTKICRFSDRDTKDVIVTSDFAV